MRRPPASKDVTLDARADRLDLRDRQFQPAVQHLPPAFPDDASVARHWQAYADAGYILNQGNDGACTGFGLAAVIHYLNWMRGQPLTPRSPRMIYHLAQFYDEWPGEDYVGSSCRGALKGWQRHGVCSETLWPYTVRSDGSTPSFQSPKSGWADDALQCTLGVYYRVDKNDISALQAALAQTGALYVSARVHAGWDRLTSSKRHRQPFSTLAAIPAIAPHTDLSGVHAFAVVGYTRDGFIVQNSWGKDWGQQGFAMLSYDDWLLNGSDAWVVAMGVPAALNPQRKTHPYDPVELPAYRSATLRPAAATAAVNARHTTALPALSSDQAYALTLVLDDNARVIQRLVEFADAADSCDYIAHRAPLAWFGRQQSGQRPKIIICAVSGILDEATHMAEIARRAPAFLSQGIYPLFLVWNNGLNRLPDILQQQAGQQMPSAALDRSIEAQAASSGLKAIWTQTVHIAARSAGADAPVRGLHALHRALKALNKAMAGHPPEIHLLADGDGALLAGEWLSLAKNLDISSVQLITPACSTAFASRHFGQALQQQRLKHSRMRLYVLTAEQEQRQRIAGIYRGSLLTLIANALEERHRTPLLGLASGLDAACLPLAQQTQTVWNRYCLREMEHWLHQWWAGKAPQGFAANGKGLTQAQKQQLHFIDPAAIAAHGEETGHRDGDALLATLIAYIKAR